MDNRALGDWIKNSLPPAWLFALSIFILFGMSRATETIKHNIASVLMTRALMGSALQADSSWFLIGDFTVQEEAPMNRAINLWEDGMSGKGNYLYALALYVQKQYAAAVSEVQGIPADTLFPNEALLLGHALFALGNSDEAGDIWREAGADFPYAALANMAYLAGDFERALPIYLRLAVIRPQDGDIQQHLGDTYRNLANPDPKRAAAAYQRAAELGQDPHQMQLLIIITELSASQDTASARAQLEELLARQDLTTNTRITALRVMHNIYRYYLDDFTQAESYLLAAVVLPREAGDIWEELQLTKVYLDKRECETAQRWLVASEERYRERISPLAQVQQLRQEYFRLCDLR